MSGPSIKSHRIIRTYMWHPKRTTNRHLLVSTSRWDGYNPNNNYNEDAETMVFEAWDSHTNPDGILEIRDSSRAIYQMHSDTVNKFVEEGFVKLRTTKNVYSDGPGRDYLFDVGMTIKGAPILDRFKIQGRPGYVIEYPWIPGSRVWIPQKLLRSLHYNSFHGLLLHNFEHIRQPVSDSLLHPNKNSGDGKHPFMLAELQAV